MKASRLEAAGCGTRLFPPASACRLIKCGVFCCQSCPQSPTPERASPCVGSCWRAQRLPRFGSGLGEVHGFRAFLFLSAALGFSFCSHKTDKPQGLARLPHATFKQAPLTVQCGRCVRELTHFLLCSSPTLKPTVMTACTALFVEQTV